MVNQDKEILLTASLKYWHALVIKTKPNSISASYSVQCKTKWRAQTLHNATISHRIAKHWGHREPDAAP